MTTDRFHASFRLRIDRDTAWHRLTADEAGSDVPAHLWLPGFDSQVTVVDAAAPDRLRATKDDEPCAGTDIVVTLEDEDTGTRVHVTQSRFGDWLPTRYEIMSVGWRYIVADLQTYLATGVHARRHLRPWGDLGAEATAIDGGVSIDGVREGTLAHRLGLTSGDLLVTLAGAPVASLDDLVTVLRVLDATTRPDAEWVRSGALMTTPSA
ncbi:MAG TPA: SRPBCC domain-containing protein [Acidimicrobiales bacterium]|nr:SRPBCC domain-containing protein [Acidimicrobiales bacterium]